MQMSYKATLAINKLWYGKTMHYTNNQLNDLDIGGICYLLIEKNKTNVSITNKMTILYKWWETLTQNWREEKNKTVISIQFCTIKLIPGMDEKRFALF